MHLLRNLVAVVALTLTGAFLHSPPATAAPPDAAVAINPQAYEGPRGTILGSLFAKCAPGFEFAGLVIDVSQADVAPPPFAGRSVTCDGNWHKQTFSTDEAFHPGPATVTARLSVTDIDTGDPGMQGVQTRDIYVRPAAAVKLPATATLRPHGVLRIVVQARCDRPWVVGDFGVDAQQGEFPDLAAGTAYLSAQPNCDGKFHSRTFYVQSVQDVAFHRGWALVSGAVTLYDVDNGDPVTAAGATRWVRVA